MSTGMSMNILNICPEIRISITFLLLYLPALADLLNRNDDIEEKGKMEQLRVSDHFSPSFLISKSKRELGGICVY